jgi:hypothetical protein
MVTGSTSAVSCAGHVTVPERISCHVLPCSAIFCQRFCHILPGSKYTGQVEYGGEEEEEAVGTGSRVQGVP